LIFSTPLLWTVRVLSWLAFGVASYLAWHAMTQTAVAGCGMGSAAGCDVVLTSSWSKWLGVPVAVIGLACYAALATLSLLLGLRMPSVSRWISAAFITLCVAAGAASLWFVGIQFLALGKFCPYCLVTDACGILLGVLATVFGIRASRSAGVSSHNRAALQAGMVSMRSGASTANRPAQSVTKPAAEAPPMAIAGAFAFAMVALLIGGQLLFASKTYEIETVALTKTIDLGSAKNADTGEAANGKTYVTQRVPTETEVPASKSGEPVTNPASDHGNAASKSATTNARKTDADQLAAAPSEPAKQRMVKLLNGKLTLNVYDHPVIGSPEAPHIVVEMISYDCPHCRKMYTTMQHARERYGDQVALLVMIVPLDQSCNKLITDPAASHQGACDTAKRAIGISRLNPGAFEQFHDFLMTGKDHPPAADATIPRSYVLAERDSLREVMRSEPLAKQLQSYIDLFAELQKQSTSKNFGLPVQILGDQLMTGSVEKEEDVFKAWEKDLGVKPK
jgi:uncharacterized membrane protein/protein-disulfide isomerase